MSRGLIKSKTGQTLDQILQSEMSTVLREVTSDLSAIAVEIAGAGFNVLMSSSVQAVTEMFAKMGARKRQR